MNVHGKILSITTVALMLLVLVPYGVESAVDFNTEMFDPMNDVKEFSEDGGVQSSGGRDYLDIVHLTSEETQSGSVVTIDWIVFHITVSGTIRSSEEVQYILLIITASDTYIVMYSNNAATGARLSDGTPFTVVDSVSGDTLNLEVRKDVLVGATSSFDWKGAAAEKTGGSNYADLAPDKLVRFTYPYHTSTKFGSVDVEGICSESINSISSLECEVDSTTVPAQDITHSSDFSTWSFTWDTTTLADGDHTLSVTVTDSQGNDFTDSIAVTINQGYASSAPTISDMRGHVVGDKADYEIEMNEGYMGLTLGGGGTEAEIRVTRVEDKNGEDCHFLEMEQDGEFTIGEFVINQNLDRYSWVTRDDKANVYEITYVNVTGENLPVEEVESTTTASYSPPMDKYQLPISVGEHWEPSSFVSSTTHKVVDGEPSDTSNQETQTIAAECLHQTSVNFDGDLYTCYAVYREIPGGERYVIEYVNEEFSTPLRMDTFDSNRELVSEMTLDTFEEGQGYWLIFEGTPTFEPSEPKVGDSVKITATVKNVGDTAASDQVITAANGNTVVATHTISSLAAGASEPIVLEWEPDDAETYFITLHTPNSMDQTARIEIEVGEAPANAIDPLYIGIIVVVILLVAIVAVMARRKKRKAGAEGAEAHEGEGSEGEPEEEHDIASIGAYVKSIKDNGAAKDVPEGVQEITCPRCGQVSQVVVKNRPMRFKCPSCDSKILVK